MKRSSYVLKNTRLLLESFTRFFSKNRRFQRRLWSQPAGCERTLASASSGGEEKQSAISPPGRLNFNGTQMSCSTLKFTPFGRSKRPNTGTLRVSRAAAGWLNIHLTGRNRQMEVHAVWPFKTAKHCFDSGGKRDGRTFCRSSWPFAWRLTRQKTFFARRIYRTTGGMKTTRNIPGTWR